MTKSQFRRESLMAAGFALTLTLAACSGGGSGGSTGGPTQPANCPDGANQFASTFEGIQKKIFEKHGCAEQVCHGSGKAGGLELTAGKAYDAIFDVAATTASLKLVAPGDNDRSYLWLKVAAKTNPGSVQINGAPMPNGLPALSADELELLRLWIYAGAPREGTVMGTEKLLDACLPDPEPLQIKPLDPPAPGEGIQIEMPVYTLPKKREVELCFASYEDFTDQVPQEFRDPSGKMFRFGASELRQDPQSHHLILYYANVNTNPNLDLHDPAFGEWTCGGGDRAGQPCEPTDTKACGTGKCLSEIRDTFACTGYGPAGGGLINRSVGGAQQAQDVNEYAPGVFAQIPMKGVFYWNSHAFNLTSKDTEMHARLNYYFAKDQRFPIRAGGILTPFTIFAMSAPPYQTETLCREFTFEQGARVFELSSHTHKRGKRFWIEGPEGMKLYENLLYNDPSPARFDPPLAFDSPDPKQRTVKYCALFNNGMKDDGSPDPEEVTRASRIPQSARIAGIGVCRPVACAAGRIGAACNGEDDDRTCDSSPGANDGDCDACRLTGGESTENEMFLMLGSYFVQGSSDTDGRIFANPSSASSGRSLTTEFLAPPVSSCRSLHAMPDGDAGPASAHAGHHH